MTLTQGTYLTNQIMSAAGVRGLQLAEAGLTSSAEGRRVAIEAFAS